jgi:hypothetical protein
MCPYPRTSHSPHNDPPRRISCDATIAKPAMEFHLSVGRFGFEI